MSTKVQQSIKNFNQGYNCAQAVLSVFCEDYGLPIEFALRLACPLGDIHSTGDLCEAATGAVMVIGLKHAPGNVVDQQAINLCNQEAARFTKAFETRFANIKCADLIDLTPEERGTISPEQFRQQYQPHCNLFVRGAVEILTDMGY